VRVAIAAGLVAAVGLASEVFLPARFDTSSVESRTKPQLIVLITIDALRADHLGVYGYQRPTSPRIDAFARESIVIDDAIAQAPYTKASIASLMTGLYPSAHKTFTVSSAVADAMDGDVDGSLPITDVLQPDLTTLAEALKARGYATAAFTTNPFLIADFGFSQGFDRFEFVAGDGFAPAEDVLDPALQVIASSAKPLFVWMHVMEPHSPYAPRAAMAKLLPPLAPPRLIPDEVTVPPYLADSASRDVRYYESLYDAEIRSVDAAIGNFLDALRERPAWRNTAVVITADHGEEFLDHGGLEHNTTLYDEMIRVPLIVRIPWLAPRYVAAQAQLVDLMPTLAALAGAPLTEPIHGRDLRPLLRGETAAPVPAFAERVGEQVAVRTRDWKLIAGPRDGRELYALTRDPREQHTLALPRRLVEMEAIMRRLLGEAVSAGKRVDGESTPIDPDVRQRLEALGYAQ
jgi:arylsulfatase A-like enzyme